MQNDVIPQNFEQDRGQNDVIPQNFKQDRGQNDVIPQNFKQDRGQNDVADFSADRPMLRDDRGSQPLRQGVRKRLLGNVKEVHNMLLVEKRVVSDHVHRCRALRQHRLDIVEVYGGFANITVEALARGLRAGQPVDRIHGISLESRSDHRWLRSMLLEWKPFLTVFEIRCDPWSNIQNLNYDSAQLQVLRDAQKMPLKEMRLTIEALVAAGCH